MVYIIYTDPEDYVLSSLLVSSRREGSSTGFRATLSEAPMLDFVPDSELAFAQGFYTSRLRASPFKSLLVGHRHTRLENTRYQSRENTTTVVIV